MQSTLRNTRFLVLALAITTASQIHAGWEAGLTAGYRGDHQLAFKEFKEGAEQGNARSQYELAGVYLSGKGVKKDHSKALEWYLKAAEQGHTFSQHELGLMYLNGKVVEQDYSKAAEWFEKGAEQGYPFSQNQLGILYLDGQGVAQDFFKSFDLFTKAAQFMGAARHNLGLMHYFGRWLDFDE